MKPDVESSLTTLGAPKSLPFQLARQIWYVPERFDEKYTTEPSGLSHGEMSSLVELSAATAAGLANALETDAREADQIWLWPPRLD